jgi:hypothetical protein
VRILVRPQDLSGEPVSRRAEPVRFGVPFAEGALPETDRLVLHDSKDRLPLQARSLDRWPDGSIRWALCDSVCDHDGGRDPRDLHLSISAEPVAATTGITIETTPDGAVIVDTGVARFVCSKANFPFGAIHGDAGLLLDPEQTVLDVRTRDGDSCKHTVTAVAVEEHGSLRAVVRVEGLAAVGARTLRSTTLLHFFYRRPSVIVDLTLHNPSPARHPGGIWELGDPGAVLIGGATVTFAMAAGDGPIVSRCWCERASAPLAGDVHLFQASSGGSAWDASNHVDANDNVPLPFRGYRAQTSTGRQEGSRATPIVETSQGALRIALVMPQFWENFPKTIEVQGPVLRLGLFPQDHPVPHEIQGGEQKTHRFVVSVGADGVADVPLGWARDPLLAAAAPEVFAESAAVPHLVPEADDPHRDYVAMIGAAIEGEDSFVRKRERIDEFGWRHFGDLYADHEAVFERRGPPLVSHYNNQYDGIAGFAVHFMRTGDTRWWRLCDDLAAHVVDIDVYRTREDKAAYNHGLFWHTAHYVDAGRSTHRSYPRAPGVHGGGPSPEHNYSDGLLLHYFLTGSAHSRQTAIDLADWVIAMDDGRRTPFRFLARGDTGVASATASPLYQGPGRGPGNSINVLLNACRLTGNQVYRDKAEALIRRCIHPADDIGARGLLDAEHRWSYTVFLHALGRYLEWKRERGEIDRMYAYARQSLLAYAEWMATHERPYLDHPDGLEYPTETWAAQELWKSEVFTYASHHAAPERIAVMHERAAFFFTTALETLARFPTRTLTRPLVLLLTHGYMHGAAQRDGVSAAAPAVAGSIAFGAPRVFIPQKVRAMRRARTIALLGAATVAAAAAYGLIMLVG